MESFCLLTLSNGSYFANILQKYTYKIELYILYIKSYFCSVEKGHVWWFVCGDEKEMKCASWVFTIGMTEVFSKNPVMYTKPGHACAWA